MNVNFICIFFLISLSSGHEIPLFKTKTMRQFMHEKDITMEQLSKFKPSPNDTLPIYKFLDTDFSAQISIGSNRQPFHMFVDIAWGDTYVPSKFCAYTEIACMLHNKYDSRTSNTYIENGKELEIGKLKGFLSQDTFHIGHTNVENQTFLEVTKFPILATLSKVDGILGIGRQALAHSRATCFINNLFNQTEFPEKTFSLYISMDDTTDRAGSLIFGAANHKHYKEPMVYLRAADINYWRIPIQSIHMKYKNTTRPYCAKSCMAVMDSKTNNIRGPEAEIREINRFLGARETLLGEFLVPCDSVPKLAQFNFTIGSINITLHGRDIATYIESDMIKLCFSIFALNRQTIPGYENDWYLGIPFFKRAFVKFDPFRLQVGIARTK